ncbi:MAG TPA: hypothetical protein VL053_08735, partial [Arachidicoccus sp.]|nr:hypothetical protein [Arachidicoccus sp.]
MMNLRKKSTLLAVLVMTGVALSAQEWKPVEGKIMTKWASKVNPAKPLRQYPRPQLKRANWQNLNGLWQYAITDTSREAVPTTFDGKILVPYAIESALSGVGKTVGKDKALWYKSTFSLAKLSKGNQLLLHFGAVDWRCDVYVNGKKVGRHEGGFDPFTFDITDALKKGKQQDIALRVWDPTDEGPQPRGKQINNPHGIWYTPVTGVWQTVWTEEVPSTYIASTRQTPDVDGSTLKVSADLIGAKQGDLVKFVAFDGEKKIGEIALASETTG